MAMSSKVLLLRLYQTSAEFKNADFEILDNFHHYHDELTLLLTEPFEITGKTFSQSHFT